jgi:hypothetical protein
MESLKATQAREIDKASVAEAEAIALNGVMQDSNADSPEMKAGDFYFRPNLVTTTNAAPSGFFRRIVWKLSGKALAITERIVYTIVISCPFCGLSAISRARVSLRSFDLAVTLAASGLTRRSVKFVLRCRLSPRSQILFFTLRPSSESYR